MRIFNPFWRRYINYFERVRIMRWRILVVIVRRHDYAMRYYNARYYILPWSAIGYYNIFYRIYFIKCGQHASILF